MPTPTRPSRNRRTLRLGAPFRRRILVAAIVLGLAQGGCNSSWSLHSGSHCGDSWVGSEIDSCGSGVEGAILVSAVYLAIAIPYLIAEACRACE